MELLFDLDQKCANFPRLIDAKKAGQISQAVVDEKKRVIEDSMAAYIYTENIK